MSQAFMPLGEPASPSLVTFRASYKAAWVIAGTLACMFALALAALLISNEGHFTYSLDQATYTHLAVAQQILNGGYGVYPGESSAPSSSILFPYLVALFSWIGMGQWAPLFINVASILLLAPAVCHLAAECGWRLEHVPAAWLVAITATVTLSLNFIGLAFTGLEHPLHILLTLVCQLGLLRFLRRDQTDWWWLASIIVLPLVRYEALAAVLADVALLLLFRKFRYAAFVMASSLLLVVTFSLYLHSLGLSYLPNSVLFNSEVASSSLGVGQDGFAVFVQSVAVALRNNIVSFGATHILVLLLAVVWSLTLWKRSPLSQRTNWITPAVVIFCTIVSVAQLAGGSLQSRSARYETYVLVLQGCTILICYRERLTALTRNMSRRVLIGVCASMLVFGSGYVIHTMDLPGAAKVIYGGPYQVRRFVVDYYKKPIASSHYGMINNGNPNDVLDLSGRISEEARRNILSKSDPRWMEAFVREHGVGLVILHGDDKEPPGADWVLAGKLETRDTSFFIPPVQARFFVTHAQDKDQVAAQLKSFAATLPAGTSLTVF